MEKATTQVTGSRKRKPSMLVDSYATKCGNCQKWRFLDSQEEYEDVKGKSPNNFFECNNCEEPEVDVAYHWSSVCILGCSRPIILKREIKSSSSDVVLPSNNQNGDDATSSKKEVGNCSSSSKEVVIIEELDKGNLDGKVAAKGKKVSILYTGKLKDTGKIFETNLGQSPLRFRIGGEKVITGLSIGVEGMRVGAKRRLTIPPSFGYSEEGFKDVVTKNAWLVYEVEAVKVR